MTNKSAYSEDFIKVFLTKSCLNPTEAIEFVKCEEAGAVIMFGGTTRNSFEHKEVSDLSYEAHEKLALRSLKRIALEALEKFEDAERDSSIHKVYLAHRLGHVPVKEESVLVVLSSTHREEGWEAAAWVLEKVKAEAEIWKKENYNDGTSSWKENETSCVHRKA